MKQVKKLPLTGECHHWRRIGEVPWDLQKYWQQRHTIFSYYDHGIHLTPDAWYGVTPEPVAIQIAEDMKVLYSPSKDVVIDLFAGVGNNAISLAMVVNDDGSPRWNKVIAIELDAATLACAQHNASLYGVADDIIWVLGDNFKYLELLLNSPGQLEPDLQVDVASTILFASPPWGGPGYRTDDVFDLRNMEPYNLAKLHNAYKSMDHALYLPRTSDVRQIAKLVPEGTKIEVVQYCVQGASKAMVAYMLAAKNEAQT
ncbi:RNA cap guanine-N2 methyltransferase-domain-containing protein [Xylariomycetidae sp. FL2044]|nr:RNA cap guanine-N2 methyltransferase-domain-containing protein [Xylariomycetidae sp. FL2044]